MKKAVIFGAGQLGKKIYGDICGKYNILAFLDNFEKRQGTEVEGVKVYKPEYIREMEYDCVFIGSMTGHDEMIEQMKEYGVDFNKIDDSYSLGVRTYKYDILSDFAKIVYGGGYTGNTAELGVFQGEYAKRINENFPDRKLYLFDTFTGFDQRDRNDQIDICSETDTSSLYDACDYLEATTVDLVLGRMKYPENCIVKKGYFPETAVNVEDKFIFVSLDVDLYKPTLEGLRYFWSRMAENGIIVIDDYFSYEGVKKAVYDFMKEEKQTVRMLPVGDNNNIILCK
ncbi:MAG: hypothetical protein NC392_06010 [Roseburia sp.]|nr:hypothetical protein [Roseburia sp.]MCM1201655.1 hypothetical protein [Bacteroides fragilis]